MSCPWPRFWQGGCRFVPPQGGGRLGPPTRCWLGGCKVVAGWCHQGGGKLVQPPTGAIDCRRLACSSSGVHALPSVPTSSTGPAGHVRPADSRWAAPTNPSLAFPPGFAPAPGAQPHSAPAHQVTSNHFPQSFSHTHTGGAAEEGLAATAVAEPPAGGTTRATRQIRESDLQTTNHQTQRPKT